MKRLLCTYSDTINGYEIVIKTYRRDYRKPYRVYTISDGINDYKAGCVSCTGEELVYIIKPKPFRLLAKVIRSNPHDRDPCNCSTYFKSCITPDMFAECEHVFKYLQLCDCRDITTDEITGDVFTYEDGDTIHGDIRVHNNRCDIYCRGYECVDFSLYRSENVQLRLYVKSKYNDKYAAERLIIKYRQLFNVNTKRAI